MIQSDFWPLGARPL
uniref:Uncharacterized protein n=1 Tax=Arundo donax TaxID=35708 RepID=A0A0A8Z3F1_ARUDO